MTQSIFRYKITSAVVLALLISSAAEAGESMAMSRRVYRHTSVPRHASSFLPPINLIHAYLPRYTEAPLYNEPPNRFPQR